MLPQMAETATAFQERGKEPADLALKLNSTGDSGRCRLSRPALTIPFPNCPPCPPPVPAPGLPVAGSPRWQSSLPVSTSFSAPARLQKGSNQHQGRNCIYTLKSSAVKDSEFSLIQRTPLRTRKLFRSFSPNHCESPPRSIRSSKPPPSAHIPFRIRPCKPDLIRAEKST